MEQQPLPQIIQVRITRAPSGVWVADCSQLSCFSVVASDEFSLLEAIKSQITMLCRAQGFEVVVARAGSLEDNVTLWSIKSVTADGQRKATRGR